MSEDIECVKKMDMDLYRYLWGSVFVDDEEYVYVEEGDYEESLDESECDIFTRMAVKVDAQPDEDGLYPCSKVVFNCLMNDDGDEYVEEVDPSVFESDRRFDVSSCKVVS